MSAAEKIAPAPAVVWLSPEGECSDVEREGWERVEIDDPISPEPVAARSTSAAEDREILERYAEQLAKIDASAEGIRTGFRRLHETLDAQEAAALRQGKQMRAYLVWAYGPIARAAVDRLRGKRKFVDTVYARLGLKKARDRVEIRDETAALAWAAEHAPDAIEQPDPYLKKSALPADAVRDGKVPGVEFIEGKDEFYVGLAPKRNGGGE